MRHWAKNLLVFLPVIGLGLESSPDQIVNSLVAFACLSLAAASVYLWNDLVDREYDRHHPQKRARAIVSGGIKVETATAVSGILFFASLGLSLLVSWQLLLVVSGYWLGALIYGLVAKRIIAFDIAVLSLLFLARVFAGSVATGIPVSQWLFATAFFAFFGLAVAKRIIEIQGIESETGHSTSPLLPGRGYQIADRETLQAIGVASSISSAVLLALFIDSSFPATGGSLEFLWLGLATWVVWLSRFWILISRGGVSHDPIEFVTKDAVSLVSALVISLVFLLFG